LASISDGDDNSVVFWDMNEKRIYSKLK